MHAEPRRRGHARQVEVHQHRLGVGAGRADVEDGGAPGRSGAMHHDVGDGGAERCLDRVAEGAEARAAAGCSAAASSARGPAHDAGDVLGARADAALLAAAVDDRLDRRTARTTSAPKPLGAPILCAERDTSVASAASTDTGTLPRAWTASVWNSAPAARQRSPIAATGCTVPTSLFTHMTETSAGCVARTRVQGRPGRRRPARPRAGSTQRRPGAPTAWAAARTALCSVAHGTHACGRPGGARRRVATEDGEVVGLGAARGEDHLARSRADRGGDLAARLLEAGAGRPPEPVCARRVAEGVRPEERQHGLAHLGADGRRRGVVEIDGSQGHGRQGSYMLATSRASTSSTRTVSWVKYGSPKRVRMREP